MRRRGAGRAVWFNERGQLVIPALFVIPSLVLFVWLIFETAKLSRDKIKHQFALDTAAFVEMGNYSDFLNRTAYVNGAFPARVGYEAFNDPNLVMNCIEEYCKSGSKDIKVYDYLVERGLLPNSPLCAKDEDQCQKLNLPESSNWGFTYNSSPCNPGSRGPRGNCTEGRDKANPDVQKEVVLIDIGTATTHYISLGLVQIILKSYNLIFTLLGYVEDSQIAVFGKFQSSHYFFSRAYSMNAPGERANSQTQLPQLNPQVFKTDQVDSWYAAFSGMNYVPNNIGPVAMSAYVLTSVKGLNTKQWMDATPISQTWDPGGNYFGVDQRTVMGRMPYVHSTVEVAGGQIWPGATPRYQVRVYP